MYARPHPGVVFRTVSEGAVLLHTEQEIYFGLNPVGAQVWELMGSGGAELESLCVGLGELHPGVELGTIRQDVTELMRELETYELVLLEESAEQSVSAAAPGPVS
jgi:hypothetical protein